MLTNAQTQIVTTSISENAIPRNLLIAVLQRFRREWIEAAGDKSLLDISAPIGLVLVDLVVGLQLNKAEAIDALGIEFYLEVQHIIEEFEPFEIDL